MIPSTTIAVSTSTPESAELVVTVIKFDDVSMATAEDVKNITGYTIGGVSPVGHLENVDIYIDNSLNRFDFLFAAAGHPNCIFKINFSDLKKITKGTIEDITE